MQSCAFTFAIELQPKIAHMISVSHDADREVALLRNEATLLAGGLTDLAQRASVYHHLFEHSGGNHGFPLLAAHGALWASGYFRLGMRMGSLIAWRDAALGARRKDRLDRLTKFANDFRDINRRVCVETYFIYYMTNTRHLSSAAEKFVPADLLDQMLRCHAARQATRTLSSRERRSLFEAFFLWEQANIVGPSVAKAFDEFDWAPIKAMALCPTITFAYFPRFAPLRFSNFSNTAERIEKGLMAFDLAVRAGWGKVDHKLRSYGIMPDHFSADSKRYFRSLIRHVGLQPELAFAASA